MRDDPIREERRRILAAGASGDSQFEHDGAHEDEDVGSGDERR
jgi:hypothetical protein